MKIELHLLQNFAPSNLNRDDTGAPKDCELGGYRRARISSQCQKRSVRETFRLEGLLADEELGARTKRLAHQVTDALAGDGFEHPRDQAIAVTAAALQGVGLGMSKKGEGDDSWKTEYLLFVPRRIVHALADTLHQNWETLAPLVQAPDTTEASGEDGGNGAGARKTSKKDAKTKAKAAYPKDIRKAVEALLESARGTADVALFGRMIADKPKWNVDASCQVAHAISTNRVQMDFDFYTAIDDFKPGDTAGSDMMGTIQFNSSCFYRYAVVDVDALRNNLDQQDGELLNRTLGAFLRAFVTAIPTGKQNSMAAHNPPSYVLAVVRADGHPISLANAFLKPARPRADDRDLVDDSVEKLETYFERLRTGFNLQAPHLFTWADRDLDSALAGTRVASTKELYDRVVGAAVGSAEAALPAGGGVGQ